jgi:hypothetical protein
MADVLLVSLGATAGLRAADDELADALRRAGAEVCVARTRPPANVRTLALTDLAWARSARAAAVDGLDRTGAQAVIYSTVTAALLWPRVGAIRFDAPAAGNRPGRHGIWQRPTERRRLRRATLLLPWSQGALAEAPVGNVPALVVPVPIGASGPAASDRDLAAVTYAANPSKKGLDVVVAAWRAARRPGEELVVAGVSADALGPVDGGVRVVGALDRPAYRQLVRRARVYVTAPRREDHGLAQLEALADGCMLVTTAAPGPYPALAIARQLDPRLVGTDLARALRDALDAPLPGYQARAAQALEPLAQASIDRLVAEELVPRLISGDRVAAAGLPARPREAR